MIRKTILRSLHFLAIAITIASCKDDDNSPSPLKPDCLLQSSFADGDEFIHDDKGRLKEIKINKTIKDFFYNEHNQVIEYTETYTNIDSRPGLKQLYQYNDKGEIIRRETYFLEQDGTYILDPYSTYTYAYDELHRIKTRMTDAHPGSAEKWIYDDRGNLKTKIFTMDGEEDQVMEEYFSYDDKVNPYTLYPFLQFYHANYSLNNVLTGELWGNGVHSVLRYEYNAYGLPVKSWLTEEGEYEISYFDYEYICK